MGMLQILAGKLITSEQIAAVFPGMEAGNAYKALAPKIVELIETNEAIKNSEGAATEAYNIMAAKSKFLWGKVETAISVTSVIMGTSVLPIVDRVSKGLFRITQAVNIFLMDHPIFTKVVMVSLIALSSFLIVVGGGIATIGLLGIAFSHGVLVLAQYNKSMIQAGMSTAKTGGTIAFVKNGMALFAATIKGMVVGALRGLMVTIRAVSLAFITSPWGIVIAALAVGALLIIKYWDHVKAFFSGFFSGFKSAMAPMVTAFKPVIAAMKPVIDVVKSLFTWIGNLLSPVKGTTEGLAKASSIGGQVGRAFAFMILWANPLALSIRAVGFVFGKLTTFFQGFSMDNVTSTLRVFAAYIAGLPAAVYNYGVQIGVRLGEGVRAFINTSLEAVKSMGTRALDFLVNFSLFDAGVRIVNSLWQGIKSLANKPVEAIRNIAAQIRDYLPFSPAKQGPLSTLNRLNFGGTIAEGIDGGPVIRKVADIFKAVAAIPLNNPSLRPIIEPLINFPENLRRSLNSGPTLQPAGGGFDDRPLFGGGGNIYVTVENINIPDVKGSSKEDVARAAGKEMGLEVERVLRRKYSI